MKKQLSREECDQIVQSAIAREVRLSENIVLPQKVLGQDCGVDSLHMAGVCLRIETKVRRKTGRLLDVPILANDTTVGDVQNCVWELLKATFNTDEERGDRESGGADDYILGGDDGCEGGCSD